MARLVCLRHKSAEVDPIAFPVLVVVDREHAAHVRLVLGGELSRGVFDAGPVAADDRAIGCAGRTRSRRRLRRAGRPGRPAAGERPPPLSARGLRCRAQRVGGLPQIVAFELVIHDALQAIRGEEFLDRLLEAGFVGGAALAVAGLEANGVLRQIAQAPAERERIERVGDEDLAQARDMRADVGLGGRARNSVDLADGATHGARSICLAGREQRLDGRIQLAEAVVFLVGIIPATREHDQVDIDGQAVGPCRGPSCPSRARRSDRARSRPRNCRNRRRRRDGPS